MKKCCGWRCVKKLCKNSITLKITAYIKWYLSLLLSRRDMFFINAMSFPQLDFEMTNFWCFDLKKKKVCYYIVKQYENRRISQILKDHQRKKKQTFGGVTGVKTLVIKIEIKSHLGLPPILSYFHLSCQSCEHWSLLTLCQKQQEFLANCAKWV